MDLSIMVGWISLIVWTRSSVYSTILLLFLILWQQTQWNLPCPSLTASLKAYCLFNGVSSFPSLCFFFSVVLPALKAKGSSFLLASLSFSFSAVLPALKPISSFFLLTYLCFFFAAVSPALTPNSSSSLLAYLSFSFSAVLPALKPFSSLFF